MSNSQDGVPQALFTDCEMWGQGGQYIFNPETGKRERVIDAIPDAATVTEVTVEKKAVSVELATDETTGQPAVKKDKQRA